MIFSRPLKPLKGDKIPRSILVVDTETHIIADEQENTEFPFKLGACIWLTLDELGEVEDRREFPLHSVEDFYDIVDAILASTHVTYVFAHNIGFDLRVLNAPQRLHQRGFLSKPPILNERTFIWSAQRKRETLHFVDTANLGVISVDQLGSDMGFAKLKVDFHTVTDDELLAYCFRDCEVLVKFLTAYIHFLIDNGLGSFKTTLASQALTAYRTRFMPTAPHIHTHLQALMLERSGYYGGRTEAFWKGELPPDRYFYLDVNSMYPYVMAQKEYPTRLIRYDEDIPITWLQTRLRKGYCIADVTLNTATNAYPKRHNTKLIFPVGRFRTVLHTAELRRAILLGDIEAIHSCATYETGRIFADYVQFFYELKLEAGNLGNKSQRYIAKLFLNTLYGKFGQLLAHREKVGTDAEDSIWRLPVCNLKTGEHYDEISWFGNIYREWKDGETLHSSPAIAGAVTAYARMHLLEYILTAGAENVFYCDTDSLIVNREGFHRLTNELDNDELGALKLEQSSPKVIIHGLKDYVFGEESKTKGVPQKAELLKEGQWKYLQFQSFKSWLNKHGEGPPRAKPIVKARRGVYHKGEVTETGRIVPFTLKEGGF